MGHSTDFVGHLDIAPALGEHELAYLRAFAGSRRWDRVGGPYAVPDDPLADEPDRGEVERWNRPARDQPGLWCDWVPDEDGRCLAWNGAEKTRDAVPWLRYLVAHLLGPRALAARSGEPALEHFTFDHRLDGMVVGCRRDTREIFAVQARGNRITRRVLRPGDPEARVWGALPYEAELDRRWAEEQARRRDGARARHGATVIDLATGRPTRPDRCCSPSSTRWPHHATTTPPTA